MIDLEKRKRSASMIARPADWPMWPILPLKRYASVGIEVGLVTPDYPSFVIHASMFQTDLIAVAIRQLKSDGDVDGTQVTRYSDVDAMLDDGWVVD